MPTGPFRLSVCNELYEKTDFAESCRSIKRAGWDGIEIAPFTLLTDATQLPAARRREVRDIIASEGLGVRRAALAYGRPRGAARDDAR